MHLALTRDKAKVFPVVEDPASYLSARIWHCGYRNLEPLRNFSSLQKLEIATYPDASFDILSDLVALHTLEVVHLPRVTSLSPLAQLMNLRRLSLRTLPSWDASGKVTIVDSLAPIAALPVLEELELFGVVPEERRIDALLGSKSLRHVRVSKYPKPEEQRLRATFAA